MLLGVVVEGGRLGVAEVVLEFGRTTRHAGHGVSQRIRKRIEEPFGWMKTVGGGRKLRYIGKRRNRAWFLMSGAVYNIIRIAALDTA